MGWNNEKVPSSSALTMERSPSLMASLIWVSVYLFGPLIKMVTLSGLRQSSTNVYLSSP